jgi:hypothetical protein
MSMLDRAAPHEPLTITHAHAHPDGHGGTHSHLHSHAGNNWHTGATHLAAPGSPDTDMPAAQLNSAAPGVYDLAAGFLAAYGVDVDRELARVTREREFQTHRVRAAADGIRDLALSLKAAEKQLAFEARGVLDGAAGFGRTGLIEAQARVNDLAAALDEACFHDQDMARRVRRQVA